MTFRCPNRLYLTPVKGDEHHAEPSFGTREDWSAARKALLEREQELGKVDEELAKRFLLASSTPSYDLPVALAIVIAPPSVPGLVVPMRVTFVSDDAFVASR